VEDKAGAGGTQADEGWSSLLAKISADAAKEPDPTAELRALGPDKEWQQPEVGV
jgi:hypothetical protein